MSRLVFLMAVLGLAPSGMAQTPGQLACFQGFPELQAKCPVVSQLEGSEPNATQLAQICAGTCDDAIEALVLTCEALPADQLGDEILPELGPMKAIVGKIRSACGTIRQAPEVPPPEVPCDEAENCAECAVKMASLEESCPVASKIKPEMGGPTAEQLIQICQGGCAAALEETAKVCDAVPHGVKILDEDVSVLARGLEEGAKRLNTVCGAGQDAPPAPPALEAPPAGQEAPPALEAPPAGQEAPPAPEAPPACTGACEACVGKLAGLEAKCPVVSKLCPLGMCTSEPTPDQLAQICAGQCGESIEDTLASCDGVSGLPTAAVGDMGAEKVFEFLVHISTHINEGCAALAASAEAEAASTQAAAAAAEAELDTEAQAAERRLHNAPQFVVV